MSRVPQPLNWQEAYDRLARARRALDTDQGRAPEEVRRILAERAQALARPVTEAPASRASRELLVFELAGERYGIPVASVVEVISFGDVVKVPGARPVLLGLVNHRGRILPLLDLRRVLDLGGDGVPEAARLVVAAAGGLTFAIFAESVAGVVSVEADELQRPPAGSTAGGEPLILGLTPIMVAVLDIDALSRDPRITVNEESA